MKNPTYIKAHAAILDYILQFCISSTYGDSDRSYGGITAFVSRSLGEDSGARVGDLVLIKSANAGKWRLSWLRAIQPLGGGDTEWLCASLADGELCRWSNVDIAYFPRKKLEEHPEWKWSDDQHEFNEKWFKACRRQDPYMYRPCQPEFNEDGSATILTRSRFDFDGHNARVRIEKWRKATLKALENHYLAMVAEHEALPREGKA